MESFDQNWEHIHQHQEWGKYPSEEVVRFIARNFYGKERRSIKLLDAGCGTGAVTWFLAREGFNVYGFDGSKTAIQKARQRMEEEAVTAELAVCDATCLPYLDNFFDGMVDSVMICANTLDNVKKILSECYRTLKPGGRFFSTGLFRPETSGYGAGKLIEPNTYTDITSGVLAGKGIVHFFSYEDITALWQSAGFTNLIIDSMARSEHGGTGCISYFMVEAQKAK
ncbi:class I SAM-dependent methyltransferase [Oscillospiraceae bacterium LTW-04]|nr:class I SAM-dependent methyltransferase [Oscillospiraceae bacterium MB24-C1]